VEQKQFKQVPQQVQPPHRQQMAYQGTMMSYVNNMGLHQNYIPPHEMVYHGQPSLPYQDTYPPNTEMYQKSNQNNEQHDYEYIMPHSTTGIGTLSIFQSRKKKSAKKIS
jgi:hypothetical protein